VESLTTRNALLGTTSGEPRAPTQSGSVGYSGGDTLILFTDGLFEVSARNGGRILGESGLRQELKGLGESPPRVVASEILRRVGEFGRAGPFEDDVSLMIARLGPPAEELRTGPSSSRRAEP
jgi:serine phosphatase RsbU (regulator of sigma subunit)